MSSKPVMCKNTKYLQYTAPAKQRMPETISYEFMKIGIEILTIMNVIFIYRN